ncbi:MAG: hypothetical protein Q9166_003367 [cf. Caloplaca sp. 2 TL-2023]
MARSLVVLVETWRLALTIQVQRLTATTEVGNTEQLIVEPQPPARVHTDLFGILASSSTFNEMDLTGFGGHRDTLATLALRRVKYSKDLPLEVFSRVLRYLDFESYRSIRLTCRCWSAAATYVRSLRLPPVCVLPAEVVKVIYAYLSPLDMNAARYTCRKWMVASLEYRLLASVLYRSGFRNAVEADRIRNEQHGHPIGGEWRLSKRLATECSLRRSWTGNGFIDTSDVASPLYLVLTHGPQPGRDIDRAQSATSLSLSAVIDFAGLVRADQASRHDQLPILRFVVSDCGRFLLVLSGPVINVYCIRGERYQHGGCVEFLIGVACPGPVLAVSMNSSMDRYSIAILLEDRKGIIVDVPELSLMARNSGSASPHSEHDTHNVTEAWDMKPSPTATPTTSQRPRLPLYTDIYHASPIGASPEYVQPTPVPIQFIPHTMYRNLCSKTSPPLTVAIAPHRRCVAFGSSAGIELHWQDIATGQELSRWMELMGPAERIHFLGPRTEDEKDLARSLRLTSSRAAPTYYHARVSLNEAWDYEHCKFLRAVPLTDNQHLLYIDPNRADFCVGTGLHRSFGNPKPIKRFILQGPCPEHALDDTMRWPRCYKAGTDLRWGARIVASFGDDIWLFAIPPDWLVADAPSAVDSLEGAVERNSEGVVIVHGVKIGSLPDIDDLAIDTSDGEVTVHAFSTRRPAQVYQIRRYPAASVRQRSAHPDGRVVDSEISNANPKIRDFAPSLPRLHDDGIMYTQYRKLDGHELPVYQEEKDDDHDHEGFDGRDSATCEKETETEDEGYASGVEDEGDGDWEEESGNEEADSSREDGWGSMQLVRLEVEVLCGG